MFRSGITDAELFTAYYKSLLAQLTQPKLLYQIHRTRRTIKQNLNAAVNLQAHDRIVELALSTMREVVSDPGFHPFSRLNAMTVISDLNQRDVGIGQNGNVVPLPEALNVMLKTLRSEEIDGTTDAMRAVALRGILRHVKSAAGITDRDKRQAIFSAAIAVANQSEPPPGRSTATQAYLRRKTIPLLVALSEAADASQRGQVVAALVGMIGDEESNLRMRCDAARWLGAIPLAEVAELNVSQLTGHLARLALQIGSQYSSPRALKSYLGCIQVALAGDSAGSAFGLVKVAGDQDRAQVEKFNEHVSTILRLIDDRKLEDEEFGNSVKQQVASLRSWISQQKLDAA